MTARAPPHLFWHRRLRALLIGILLLAGLILTVTNIGQLEQFVRLARSIKPGWLLLALFLQAATYVCAAGVWYGPLQWGGTHSSLASLVPLGIAKLFSDQALPSGGMSGTAFFVTALRRRGVPAELCLAALLVSVVGYHAAFLVGAAVTVALLWFYHAMQPWIVLLVCVFTLVVIAILAGVMALDRWPEQLSALLRRLPGLLELADQLTRAPRTLLRDSALLLRTAVLHGTVFLLDAGTLWVMLRAIGQEVSYAVVFPSFMVATVAASVGLIPLGLGTFEATCVVMLGLLGVRLEAALTATLLLRGLTLWLPMLPGLYLARRALR